MTGKRLLLVDDDFEFTNIVEKRLTRRHIPVSIAHNCKDALEMLSQDENIDLICLDVDMPKMDGIETLGFIRKLHPKMKVILISNQVNFDCIVEGSKLGVTDFMMKPLDLSELLMKIKKMRSEFNRGAFVARAHDNINAN